MNEQRSCSVHGAFLCLLGGGDMSKLELIVAVKEADYARRLADYIRDHAFGESWRLTVFTNPQALRQYLKGGYPADLVAAQAEMLAEAGDCRPEAPVARLVPGPARAEGEVAQYQPLPSLLMSLQAVYASGGGIPADSGGSRRGGAAVTAIFDAAGGLGKTTLALHLARQAGLRGDRVFYLNLEQWNATGALLGEDSGTAMADMLYLLHTQPENAASKLAGHRKHSVMMKADYFPPAVNPEERMAMGGEEAAKLIGLLAGSGEYDLIIADMDSKLDPVALAVFERSDAILWLLSPSVTAYRKTELALEYARRKWARPFRETERKISFVLNRCPSVSSEEPQAEAPPFKKLAARLPEVGEWNGAPQPDIWSAPPRYRGAVEQLLEALGRKEVRGHVRGGYGAGA